MTVYFVQVEDEELIKIGYTAGDVYSRMAQLQTGQPHRLKLIGTIPGGKDAEAGLHKEFAGFRVGGEWFRLPEELMQVIMMLIDKQASWYLCRASSGLINITSQLRKENEELKKQLDEKIDKSKDVPVWVTKEIARKHRQNVSYRAEIELLKNELKTQSNNHVFSTSRDWLIPALLKHSNANA